MYDLEPKAPKISFGALFIAFWCLLILIHVIIPGFDALPALVRFIAGGITGILFAELADPVNRLYFIFNWKEDIKWKVWH